MLVVYFQRGGEGKKKGSMVKFAKYTSELILFSLSLSPSFFPLKSVNLFLTRFLVICIADCERSLFFTDRNLEIENTPFLLKQYNVDIEIYMNDTGKIYYSFKIALLL